MDITLDFHGDQFNINLHGAPGADPFLSIKGCRIVNGQNGPFISYPSRKMENGKYWQHVYGGEKFNAAVLKKAQEGQRPSHDGARARQLDKPASDIPF